MDWQVLLVIAAAVAGLWLFTRGKAKKSQTETQTIAVPVVSTVPAAPVAVAPLPPAPVPETPGPAPAVASLVVPQPVATAPAPVAVAPAPVPLVSSFSPPEPIDPGAPYGRNPSTLQPFTREEADAYARALAKRAANLGAAAADHATARYNGPVPVASVSREEAIFLLHVVENYRFNPAVVDQQSEVLFALMSGTAPEINAVMADADTHRAEFDPLVYNGRMLRLVDDFANGRLRVTLS